MKDISIWWACVCSKWIPPFDVNPLITKRFDLSAQYLNEANDNGLRTQSNWFGSLHFQHGLIISLAHCKPSVLHYLDSQTLSSSLAPTRPLSVKGSCLFWKKRLIRQFTLHPVKKQTIVHAGFIKVKNSATLMHPVKKQTIVHAGFIKVKNSATRIL